MLVINPKRVSEELEIRPYWYNYYAGYSHTFTRNILESANLKDDAIILDPWNGSGTTTLVASMLGYTSIGIDLNPVMKIIAMSKIANIEDAMFAEQCIRSISLKGDHRTQGDPLCIWFKEETVSAIRQIERAIIKNQSFDNIQAKVDSLSTAQCLIYTSVFNILRKYLSKFIPSNPTWIKKPKSSHERVKIDPKIIKSDLVCAIKGMVIGTKVSKYTFSKSAKIITASSSSLPIKPGTIDFVVTSPPYCTRIDYGVATYPELALLSGAGEQEMDLIRRSLMGTTTVPKFAPAVSDEYGAECKNFINAVKNHGSRASDSYYLKNLSQYFSALKESISEIDRVLKNNSKVVCVVQDSYYKEVHCDLPRMVSQIAMKKKFHLLDQIEFEAKQNMANVNQGGRKYRTRTKAIETVLIFEKL